MGEFPGNFGEYGMRASKSGLSLRADGAGPCNKATERRPSAQCLALTLLLPVGIVLANSGIGALTPITANYDDDMSLIDPVWRLVQGQQLGIDFHDPRGLGLFYVAGILWRLLGPHYYVLRASSGLFALVIVFCGWLVARRQLHHMPELPRSFA